MLEFHAHRFVECMNLLNDIRFSLVRKESFLYSGGTYRVTVLEQLGKFNRLLEQMDLKFTAQSVERLAILISIDHPIPPPKEIPIMVEQRISEVSQRLRDELAGQIFLRVDNRALFEQESPLFGKDVDNTFPSIAIEVAEAGKCLALRRPTACVMHLMRVLEVGLECLASELGVPFKENWNALLDQIERVIPTISKSTHSADDEQWFAGVATHFRFLKNAWRNHAMHVRERYAEDEAEEIFQQTRSFMRQLSKRLADPLGKLLA